VANEPHLGDTAADKAKFAARKMIADIERETGPLDARVRESMLTAATLGYMVGFGDGLDHAYKQAGEVVDRFAKGTL
jgi:hypothetical protein